MENNVTSLETAEKLKAAGFPQQAVYYWYETDNPNFGVAHLERVYDNMPDYADVEGHYYYAAPTAQEIADQLPDNTKIKKDEDGYSVADPEDGLWDFRSTTMAEALAALYLKINEQKGTE